MFRFENPLWLWAVTAAPLLLLGGWWAAKRRARALHDFADPELARRLTASVHHGARRWKLGLQAVAVALVAVALARPQFGDRVETVRSVGQDIVVAVDLSASMLAEDVSPNRLERARLAILRLLRQLDGDRIGLVAFAADAFVQSPLTIDYSAAGMFLGAMHPELMPVQGTDLGAAMRVSLDALEEGSRDARVLVIVTDGEDHEDGFAEQLVRARDEGVQVYLVGIGTTEGVPIPEFDQEGRRTGFLRDEDGAVVTTRLEEGTFGRIVEETGASYVRAGSGGTAFDELVDRIASGRGEEIDAMQVTRFEEQFQVFLGLALLLLVVEILVSDRRRADDEWTGRFE